MWTRPFWHFGQVRGISHRQAGQWGFPCLWIYLPSPNRKLCGVFMLILKKVIVGGIIINREEVQRIEHERRRYFIGFIIIH